MTQQSGYNRPGFWTFIIVLLGNLAFFAYLLFYTQVLRNILSTFLRTFRQNNLGKSRS